MRVLLAVCFALLVPACTEEYVTPGSTYPARPAPRMNDLEIDVPALTVSQSSILVTPDKNIGRPTEVVGVLDFHSRAESEDKGFDQLRAKAASLGADAVIGAEFEHGENGGPSHLSGMAVHYR